MTFVDSGNLLTDKQTINDSFEWDTQTEWEAFQSATDIQIESGVVKLADALPASIVTLYEYEDDSNTGTAIDSVGTNDATINGSTYTATAAAGSLALDHDGTDDYAISGSAVDLPAAGTTDGFGFGGFVQADTLDSSDAMFQYFSDSNNYVLIQVGGGNSNYSVAMEVNGTFDGLTEGGTVETAQFAHIWANVTQSNVALYKDNTELFTAAHSFDITNLGAGNYVTGRDNLVARYFDGKVDDFALSTDPLDSSGRQAMVDRAT